MAMNDIRITERVILFNLNQTYYDGIPDDELYENTRCCWRLSEAHARKADYAMGVFQGTIVVVYRIDPGSWEPVNYEGSTRWRFTGKIANDEKLKRYIGKRVSFSSQNPVRYLNC